jgi:predicted AlkP superfamily pyrophosphatase or phosphodiesterase
MPKVFILALDGLEYNLVVKWNLTALMQKQHGKITLAPKYYHVKEHVPYTPTIWASFITGKPPRQHGVNDWWTYNKLLNWIRTKPPLTWLRGKRLVLSKIGLKPRTCTRKDWKRNIETIFDKVNPSIALFIPAYNEAVEPHEKLSQAMAKGLHEYEKQIEQVHRWRMREMYRRLMEEWRLFMVWLDIADLMGHIHYVKQPEKLEATYKSLNSLVVKLKEQLCKTTFLIVSDHGMTESTDGVTGNHSNHAFWSLNIESAWKPKDITDFYPKILEWAELKCGLY